MVCRTHKYADGGKVVKDHLKEPPKPTPGMLGSGLAAKAATEFKNRGSKLDKAIADAGG